MSFHFSYSSDQIPDRIDDWRDTLNNTAKITQSKGIAKTNNLLATLGSLDENDMTSGTSLVWLESCQISCEDLLVTRPGLHAS